MNKLFQQLEAYYGQQKWWDVYNQLFSVTEMVLIQNTNSANVEKAMVNLRPYLTDLKTVLALPEETLATFIRPSGYYKIKAKRLRAVYQWLAEHPKEMIEKIPTADLRIELLNIYGIGNETADVMMLYLYNRSVFVADNYARRLFERLGFGKNVDYNKMREIYQPELNQWSVDRAKEFHALIDEHCKAHCLKKPHCKNCPLLKTCQYPAKDLTR